MEKIGICNANQNQYKEKPFCMSSNNFFVKDGLKDNNWVSHLWMKSAGAMYFQKKKEIR